MCIKIKRILVCIFCCTMKMIDKLINQNENGTRFAKQVGNNNHICLLLGEYKGMKLKTFGWKNPKSKKIQVKYAPKSHSYTLTCRSWIKSTHYIQNPYIDPPTHSLAFVVQSVQFNKSLFCYFTTNRGRKSCKKDLYWHSLYYYNSHYDAHQTPHSDPK